MKLILVGVSGRMRTGKDTVANRLVEKWGFKRISLADKLREVCRGFLHFPPDEYGPGPKTARARRALQLVGTEVGRELDPDVWITHLFERIITDMGDLAHQEPRPEQYRVVVPDIRFPNELEAIRRPRCRTAYHRVSAIEWPLADRGEVWRITRDIPQEEKQGEDHESETALNGEDSGAFDRYIDNNGTIKELHAVIDALVSPRFGHLSN